MSEELSIHPLGTHREYIFQGNIITQEVVSLSRVSLVASANVASSFARGLEEKLWGLHVQALEVRRDELLAAGHEASAICATGTQLQTTRDHLEVRVQLVTQVYTLNPKAPWILTSLETARLRRTLWERPQYIPEDRGAVLASDHLVDALRYAVIQHAGAGEQVIIPPELDIPLADAGLPAPTPTPKRRTDE